MSGYRTSTAIYGGVLALLMGASWLQWTAEPEVELDGKIVLLPGEADDIERIVWTSEGKDEAMKIAARQNREILRILQEAVWKSNFGRPTPSTRCVLT